MYNFDAAGTQLGLNGLSNMIGDYSMNSDIGMDGDLGLMSMNNGILGYGGYYGPGSETRNMTREELLEYNVKLQKLQMKENAELKTYANTLHLQSTSEEGIIAAQIGNLDRKIKNNDQDHIGDEYGKLSGLIRKKLEKAGYDDISEEQIRASVMSQYKDLTGDNVVDAIKNHGDSEFWQGCQEGFFGLGFLFKHRNREDNISDITKEDVNKVDKVSRWGGRILAGTVAFLTLPFLLRGGKAGGKWALEQVGNSWGKVLGRA